MTATVLAWNDSLDLQFDRKEDRRPLTEKADPLALSWAAYHVWGKFPNRRYVEWRDLEAKEHDFSMAAETRRYYRNRLALRALKGQGEPSQFSRDLYDICNGGIMRVCHMGMLYRLPYFYVEDTRRAELIEHTHSQPTLDVPPYLRAAITLTLRRYNRIFHSRKRQEIMEYWFHDEATGNAVLWAVDYDNPLRSLVESVWRTQDRIRLKATYLFGHDRLNDWHFWRITQPEIQSW
jgi:hypothetical protein